jgi:hypothetical protein
MEDLTRFATQIPHETSPLIFPSQLQLDENEQASQNYTLYTLGHGSPKPFLMFTLMHT